MTKIIKLDQDVSMTTPSKYCFVFFQPPSTTDDLTVVDPGYVELEKLAQGIERLGAIHLNGRLHLAYTYVKC